VKIKTKILTLSASILIIPMVLLLIVSISNFSVELKKQIMTSAQSNLKIAKYTMERFCKSYDEILSSLNTVDKSTLDKINDKYEGIDKIYLLDKTNSNYKAIKDSKETKWFDLDNKDYVTVAKAVYNDKGEFLDVAAIDISLDTIGKIVKNLDLGNGAYYMLTDENKILIYHSTKEKIGTELSTEAIKQKAYSTTDNGYVEYNYQGEDKVGFYATIADTNWRIVGAVSLTVLDSTVNKVLTVVSVIGIIIALIAGSISIIFAKKLVNPIVQVSKELQSVAGGDFTIKSEVKSKDETSLLAKAVNDMTSNLSVLFNDISDAALKVSESSDTLSFSANEMTTITNQVSHAVYEISNTSTNQAHDTQNGYDKASTLAESINNLTSAIEEMEKEIIECNSLSGSGMSSIIEVATKANENDEAVSKVNEAVVEVDSSAKQINVIVNAITSIAEQTNLLALNASIEAARAGEAGKGFSVVADEIRKLAEESATASNTIRELIQNIQHHSDNAVNAIKISKDIATTQNVIVDTAKDAFTKISNSLDSLIDWVGKINILDKDMIEKKDLIVSSMENLSASAQQTAAATEEVSASMEENTESMQEVATVAETLNKLSQRLKKDIEVFKFR